MLTTVKGVVKNFRDTSAICLHINKTCFDACNTEIFRSADSFHYHHKAHTGTAKVCKVCKMQFNRKTNHMQKHSEFPAIVCKICDKEFTYRQNGIEYIQWFHREKKEYLCPICKKPFQMPTYMRAHNYGGTDLLKS